MKRMPAENDAVKPCMASVGTAVPLFAVSQLQSLEHLLNRYGDKLSPRSITLMRKIFNHPGIKKRHFAIDDSESFFNEDPDKRIARFNHRSVELSATAILRALAEAGLSTDDVTGLVVNTCTGYICPGISTYLIEKLSLSRKIRAYDLVGSGCGGAIPNLQIAQSLCEMKEKGVIVSVSVEICSATFQMEDELSLIVSNALFGDGAAAAVLWKRPEGLQPVASASIYAPEDRDAIRYVHKNGQLYNQLATNLPHLVKKAAAQAVNNVLKPRSLDVRGVKYWAIHPGGEKILNTLKDEIGLSEEQLIPTRFILAEYGNMSSPTALFVLQKLMEDGMKEGEWCMMLAFGAGLSAHAMLLRKK